MAITFEKLQELLRKQNFHFLIASDQPLLRAGVAGIFGHYEFVILLQDEGQFLQFPTVSYLHCPSTARICSRRCGRSPTSTTCAAPPSSAGTPPTGRSSAIRTLS